ncbi:MULTISPECIES: tRNA (N6-isopentenyl adenosine(37)-C2)-methylthiotransferase MiaB [Myxococcus]|uniref:tRNA-2-methylthio-N(6)-dimethylallyladenosine synthase n=1 Tax=Myxococcus xanthus TaxID=34 RepID=A0AAE6G0N3_MYXXA|nr:MULTISPECIES: tRNA (N6-isopentenyl adenosine(37)-C2)-methylthiotransferase MiaB [Myxococcus]QDE68840.1 tRNA (N6-isopentenyl adenosine(37)-C2)-methylthiotransferase MiaB [Myxococcus xanthus]QDE76116.1 tRNA (N6-isopentenyl adenosine(37)-C2)-methylthiotransferase MiaB [Myxococcus xanthus]QDE83542.1 tRNA (N6-isopentenyl adenosine(37)-C2)-methylthiotransferase MiaB [Myxococcus xanthus]QDE97664.1 tRNA (N6-isopentenyl adenosine(37)-C2)-methylthiotransferase MiaB [Myxococcus xanthus]QDF05324.1 tRNA
MKRYFIHTFGCQMNVNDSLRMSEVLSQMSYAPTPVPDNADLIILNTCSIREKAEDKMLSALGRYKPVKASRGALIGVGGCVAQQEKDKLLKKVPYLDFVFGPDNIARLPDIIGRVSAERERVVETAFVNSEEYVFPRADPETSRGKVTEFVTVMKGCDNVCSFCIVPHTRGREVSRAFPDVLVEVADLAKVGVREVTLIGQNVNSYAGGISFAQLLLRTAEVPGIERVRFTTSHPHDLSDELIEAFRVQPKITPHFHLPVQCGSDRILKMMRRDYTVVQYLERLAKLREARPGIAVTTDIIVGFPGETEEEFEMTMQLTEQVRYDNQFSFVYSPRPKTGAALREKDWGPVPHEVKIARLERLQKLQRRISGEITAALVGSEVEVMVEGHSRYDATKRFGRTPENRTVNFEGDAPAGAFVTVKVERATPNQLSGKQVALLKPPTVEPLPVPMAEAPFHVVAEA